MSKKKNKRKEKRDENTFVKNPTAINKIDTQSILNENYPIFCFKYLSDRSIKKCQDPRFYFDFLMRLKELSEKGWTEIRKASRHSIGLEPLPTHEIKPALPACITPEIKKLHVFRVNGNNLPFVGIQIQNIFRILFIETNFGDIYDHKK
jgi:hypothetical protein